MMDALGPRDKRGRGARGGFFLVGIVSPASHPTLFSLRFLPYASVANCYHSHEGETQGLCFVRRPPWSLPAISLVSIWKRGNSLGLTTEFERSGTSDQAPKRIGVAQASPLQTNRRSGTH